MLYRIRQYTMSSEELKEIGLAWALLSLAFAILFTGRFAFSFAFILSFSFAAITVGVSFLCHELAHKVIAQQYGCHAEFRAFKEMLIFAVLLSFTGIILAAPGAVFISGYVNRIASGKIAAAGPLTNLVLGVFFLLALVFYPGDFLRPLLHYGLSINAMLALFNLIPFSLFDGAKIFLWDKQRWGAMIAIGIVLMFMAQVV